MSRWWYGRWRAYNYRPRIVVEAALAAAIVALLITHNDGWPVYVLFGALGVAALTSVGAEGDGGPGGAG